MSDKKTKYITIYETIRDDIVNGRYRKGAKLPSKRVTAEKYDVSVITVEHAYELLAEEGYIIAREKSGFFVAYDDKDTYYNPAGRSRDIYKEIKKERTEVFGGGVPFSASIYARTCRRVMSEVGDYIMQKSPMQGLEILRDAIAAYLSRSRRMNVDISQIIVGAGAEYLYGLIVQTFGRNVIYGIESPSYNVIAKVYESGGARLDMLELGRDGIESEALWNSKAKILHISPYRSFPSGVTASAIKRMEYLAWSREKDAIIIEDDFESEFTLSRKTMDTVYAMDDDGRVIYVNTFTQTIGPSVRAAYMVIPKNLKELFEEKTGFLACPLPTLEQLIIAEIINNGDFERHINRVRRNNKNKKINDKH
ncbi:MAG: PLP-dependent aminotransferase family protein [Lachnospiraceae bacterium]|nr:PLP-dependent aminotransferase family protein [Lachnospiraceae bacterium]